MVAVPILVGENITDSYLTQKLNDTAFKKYQTIDFPIISQITYSDSADLVIPVTAGASYTLETCLISDTASGPDISVRFSYPSGTTGLIASNGQITTAAGSTNAINLQATSLSGTSVAFNYGGSAAGTFVAATPAGGFSVTNSGNFTVGIAQVVSTASNTILKKWSWICLARVA
jgi:hypothetical protein